MYSGLAPTEHAATMARPTNELRLAKPRAHLGAVGSDPNGALSTERQRQTCGVSAPRRQLIDVTRTVPQ